MRKGDTAANSRLLAEVRPHKLGPGDRAAYELLIETFHGTRWSGGERLVRFADAIGALAAAGDADKAIRLLDTIVLRAHFADPDPAATDRLVAAIDRVAEISDDPQLPGHLALVAPVTRGDTTRRRMRELLAAGGTDPNTTYQLGLGAGAAGDCALACEFHAAAEVGLRAQGRLGVLYRAQIAHAMQATHLGDARTARALLAESESLAPEMGDRNWVPTAWAERSRTELRASGESLRRPGSAGLTPQETQIARLAAGGLTNQEIAERLVLSPRTVTTHLSRIYPKLGIRSRVELARALGIT